MDDVGGEASIGSDIKDRLNEDRGPEVTES